MIKRFIFFLITLSILIYNNPVYSKEFTYKTIEKYTNKISNKFSRTYCNTTQFGISNEGALSFAIGETNKEFKNSEINNFIDYTSLKNKIFDNLENYCQIYDFRIDFLDKLDFN